MDEDEDRKWLTRRMRKLGCVDPDMPKAPRIDFDKLIFTFVGYRHKTVLTVKVISDAKPDTEARDKSVISGL